MINNVTYKGFKCFDEQFLSFRPITLLLGPNNSGKSSLIAGLRLLGQTAACYDSNVPLLFTGSLGDFGTYKDLVFKNSTKRHIEIVVCSTSEKPSQPLGLAGGIQTKMNLRYRYRSSLREVILQTVDTFKDNTHLISATFSEDSDRLTIHKLFGKEVPPSIRPTVSRDLRMRNFLPYLYYVSSTSKEKGTPSANFLDGLDRKNFRMINYVSSYLHSLFSSTEYIGAMRMPPARTYVFSGERRQHMGAAGQYAPAVLAMDSRRKGSRAKNILQRVVEWMQCAGIASDLKVNLISDRHFEVKLQHPVTHEYENLADVGYGISQVLPVLVGGYNMTHGQMYMVEEPEIHLHPRAQAELGEFLVSLYKNKIQAVVETHSEHLVLRLQQLVANGTIKEADIVFHYICAKGESKCATELLLDHQGRFVNNWPEGFFPERLEEAKALARARRLGG